MDILKEGWNGATGAFHTVSRFLYGDLLDDGLGKFFAICLSAIVAVYFIAGYRSIVEWFRASDVEWDTDAVERHNLARTDGTPAYKIDWRKAHDQKGVSLRFTVPFGALVIASLIWLRFSFTLSTYMTIAALWLVAAMPLRVWWIHTARRLTQHLLANGYLLEEQFKSVKRPVYKMSLRQAVRHYVDWGTQASSSEGGLIGRYRWWANPLGKLFRFKFLRTRLIRAIWTCTFYALVWPIAMVIAPFYLTEKLTGTTPTQLLKPEWARRHASEPDPNHGIIRDTPGDAAAAAE